MNNNRASLYVILFLLSFAGLWQFSHQARSVDAIGLFASGALAGAAIALFITSRK